MVALCFAKIILKQPNIQVQNSILLIEDWESKEQFEAYIKWRTDRGDYAKLLSLLSVDPVVDYFMNI